MLADENVQPCRMLRRTDRRTLAKRRGAYQRPLAMAQAALDGYDRADAIRHLEAAPAALRRWEWKYLRANLDQSLHRIGPVASLDHGLAFFPAGGRVATVDDHALRILDAVTGATIKELGSARGLFSATGPAGTLLFSQESDGSLARVDESGRRRKLAQLSSKIHVSDVILTPDGNGLAYICSPDPEISTGSQIRVADLKSGCVLKETEVSFRVMSLAFSPNGRTIALAGENPKIYLWDLTKNKPTRWPDGLPEGRVFSVAFSPDGSELASASDDQTVRQFDARQRRVCCKSAGAMWTPSAAWRLN